MHTKGFDFLRSLVTSLSLVTMLVGAVGPMSVLASHTAAPLNYAVNAVPVGNSELAQRRSVRELSSISESGS